MGMLGRLGAFIGGGLLGAGVGAAIAVLNAPQSGDDLRKGVTLRVDLVKMAGVEAQTRTEEELIRSFRAQTGDPSALRDDETQLKVDAARAIADLGLSPTVSPASASS
ncbi:MAG: YtxH domain-containing protein [Thermomicrobiales bacterium]|nr:YtxH domain-containing protein [Thermomicrobiales bacterium]